MRRKVPGALQNLSPLTQTFTQADPWPSLIAIMLGRLRMSLGDCERAYVDLSKQIITPKRNKADPRRLFEFLRARGKFNHHALEQCVKYAMMNGGMDEDTLLHEFDEETNRPCKVFVCATRAASSAPTVMRSYEPENSNDTLLGVCKVWEAARATCAVSTFFDPVAIGPYKEAFVSGALRRNNPIREANKESLNMWPGKERVIVSIGMY